MVEKSDKFHERLVIHQSFPTALFSLSISPIKFMANSSKLKFHVDTFFKDFPHRTFAPCGTYGNELRRTVGMYTYKPVHPLH